MTMIKIELTASQLATVERCLRHCKDHCDVRLNGTSLDVRIDRLAHALTIDKIDEVLAQIQEFT
jgi:hypothetical protein